MITRLRWLEKLELHQPRPSREPDDGATNLWAALEASADAESAGRMFSWLPPEPQSSEAEDQLAMALRDGDRIAKRLRRIVDQQIWSTRS
jgi:hypothetical protein